HSRIMRSVLATAGWLAAAVVATLIGLGAVNVIGTGITDAGTGEAYSPERVARELASPTAPVPPGASPSATPTSPPAAGVRPALSTPGGVVVAECVGDDVLLSSWTPAQGFRVTDFDRGPDDDAAVRFEGPTGEVEVHVRCVSG